LAVLSISFVAGSEVLKSGLLDGNALMDLTDSGGPELVFDVDVMIAAHSARETTVQVQVASKERKREGGGGGAQRIMETQSGGLNYRPLLLGV
jgi:hypothetical protein